MKNDRNKMKHRSAEVSVGPERAPHRAMFQAMGFTDERIARPRAGVASSWNEITPCNYHLHHLAKKVKEGDWITVDAEKRELSVRLTDKEIRSRLSRWTPPSPRFTS